MRELEKIWRNTSLSLQEFADVLELRRYNLLRMMDGRNFAPPGVLTDAAQLVDDELWGDEFFGSHPELLNIPYQVAKACMKKIYQIPLDNTE